LAEQVWTLAEAVAWPVTDVDPRLRFSDRALLRLARVMRRLWPRVEREPAGSPLRRRLAERVIHVGWAATNAQRSDALAPLYHEDVVGIAGAGLPPELGPVVHGWDALREVAEGMFFGGSLRNQPQVFIDFGGAMFGVRMKVEMTGRVSGLDVATEYTTVYEVRDARVARQWMSTDDAEIDAWLAERRAELEGERG
jgi:hypothetical protein